MPLTETVFRMHQDSSLASIFQEEKFAVGSLWCNNGERDVIEVKAQDYASIKKMKKKLYSNSDCLSSHLSVRDNSLLILQRCSLLQRRCGRPRSCKGKLSTHASDRIQPGVGALQDRVNVFASRQAIIQRSFYPWRDRGFVAHSNTEHRDRRFDEDLNAQPVFEDD